MSETSASHLLETAVVRYMTTHLTKDVLKSADHGSWLDSLWEGVESQGFTLPAVAEQHNGGGGTLAEEYAVVRGLARTTTPLPVPETALAGWLLSTQEQKVPKGPLTVAPTRARETLELRAGAVVGRVTRIPWGRNARAVVAIADGRLVLLGIGDCGISTGANLAGEPRDTLSFDGVKPYFIGDPVDPSLIMMRGAAIRATQLAAASAAALELTVGYVRDRVQFGRPLGSFQAIQQQIALAASRVAEAQMAAQLGYRAFQRANDHSLDALRCAVAKSRACEAAAAVAAISHQAHGAMGFTEEYPLQRLTRRIQSWRSEFGSQTDWTWQLGRAVLAAGGSATWPLVVALC